MRKIVVGYDGSQTAMWALDWSARLVGENGELYLIHALGVPLHVRGSNQSQDLLDRRHAQAHASLVRIGYNRAEGAGVYAHVARGTPEEGIVQAGDEHGAHMIALGRSNQGRLSELMLGSTCSEVMATAKQPVLVAGGPAPEVAPEKALVAVDGSSASIRALQAALEWFEPEQITLLHAYSKETPRATAEAVTADCLKAAGGAVGAIQVQIAEANPTDAILNAAQKEPCLVFLGRRGLTPLQGLILGSVSTNVVRQISGAVVVVR